MRTINDLQVGAPVVDKRDQDVGTVKAVRTGHLVLARTAAASEVVVPFTAVESSDPGAAVKLNVEEADFEMLGWDEPA